MVPRVRYLTWVLREHCLELYQPHARESKPPTRAKVKYHHAAAAS